MRKTVIFILTIICMLSCATFKSHKKQRICDSTYKIMSVTKTDSEKPQVVCYVWDANNSYAPAYSAKIISQGVTRGVVEYWDRDRDRRGRVEFEMPIGKHSIRVEDESYKYDRITTYEIDFEPYTKTEIIFELGYESMGLPCDYSKHKGIAY